MVLLRSLSEKEENPAFASVLLLNLTYMLLIHLNLMGGLLSKFAPKLPQNTHTYTHMHAGTVRVLHFT